MTTTVPKESVPLHDRLKRMRATGGDCLAHCCRLMRIHVNDDQCPYLLCQGPAHRGILHCWLEAGEIVVDLTRPRPMGEKFYHRSEYYSVMGIEADAVKRYTVHQIGEFGLKGGAWEFWEFDTTQYLTK